MVSQRWRAFRAMRALKIGGKFRDENNRWLENRMDNGSLSGVYFWKIAPISRYEVGKNGSKSIFSYNSGR
jgi:hypothetical protein